MNFDRGIADGAEREAAGQPSNIASVQVGIGQSNSDNPSVNTRLKSWKPNEQLMVQLTSMGIDKMAATKALFYTNNTSAELATAWIFENPNADLETPLELEVENNQQESSEDRLISEVYKMVFVVNAELEMGVGKIAAQVAHAALGMHQLLLQNQLKYGDSLFRWFEFGETKIVLKGDSTQHLIELEKNALGCGLPTYLVHDAGRTQVKSGSTTVLCIFGQINLVDQVTGSLRLL